jgi:hypothetical protein
VIELIIGSTRPWEAKHIVYSLGERRFAIRDLAEVDGCDKVKEYIDRIAIDDAAFDESLSSS